MNSIPQNYFSKVQLNNGTIIFVPYVAAIDELVMTQWGLRLVVGHVAPEKITPADVPVGC